MPGSHGRIVPTSIAPARKSPKCIKPRFGPDSYKVRPTFDRSNVGRTLYESGPKRGLMNLGDFLAGAIEVGTIRPCDPGIAAQHLLALLEAELLEIATLGYEVKASRAKL